jgi:hypothetical protein
MAGMIQILTYLLAFYLVIKGVEVLQIGLASARPSRVPVIITGGLTLVACILAAFAFTVMQDAQAAGLSAAMPSVPTPTP